MNQTLDMYKAAGNKDFTHMVTEFAPYFKTIDPLFVELRPGYAEITVANQKKIHNHLGTVHAIAMCNAAELVAGMMTEVSIPESMRWIPVGMTVKYLAKAKTDLKVVASGETLDWAAAGNRDVPVIITDTRGIEVFTAVITMNVSAKK